MEAVKLPLDESHGIRWSRVRARIRQIIPDERGEIPIGQLLIIALIVIPLVLLLIFYRDEIAEFVKEQWDRVMNAGEYSGPGA